MWPQACVITALVLYFSLTILPLYRNYVVARKVGLPIIISPVNPLGVFWLLLGVRFIPLIRLLPNRLSLWTHCTEYGGGFNDRTAIHKRVGPVFMHVNPAWNELVVADATSAASILNRRKDFIKPQIFYERLNVFGSNVDTVEGDDWQRQRKLTAPCFNEKTSKGVWDIASNQAKSMVEHNMSLFDTSTNSLQDDSRTIAMNVLVGIGFGIMQDFLTGQKKVDPGYSMSYVDSLRTIIRNILFTFIFPHKVLLYGFMPRALRKVGIAIAEFGRYNHELLAKERDAIQHEQQAVRNNLLSTLVRSSDAEDSKTGKKQGLSEEEILGNMFIFSLAGHDTTANTITFAIGLLAVHPEWQTWIQEELDYVFGAKAGGEYEDAFSKLKRCQAVVFETLRLWGSVPFIVKSTGAEAQPLELPFGAPGSAYRQCILSPNTMIHINLPALHISPENWGSDSLTFRPSRWIQTGGSVLPTDSALPKDLESERLITPRAGEFIPWAMGPRNCLGMKFAQVEAVSVLSTVFKSARVKPSLAPELRTGQYDLSDGRLSRKLAMEVLKERRVEVTITIARPHDLWLKWEMREG
ncbi:cytochrome P450 [Rhizodiscina lignyota]|uniref:Cytochrome P450 n=1 Tax=Rhizodiscina lignyota TaxID=1504668 RepID=A0A9P4M2R3_9PEZI|nr:cytochrome P450 [Rhizodiscina lignyota]